MYVQVNKLIVFQKILTLVKLPLTTQGYKKKNFTYHFT